MPDEFDRLRAQSGEPIRIVVGGLASALASRDVTAIVAAQDVAADVFGRIVSVADVLGRRRTALDFRAALGGRGRALGVAIVDIPEIATVPRIPFIEAVDDILARTPEIAANAEEVAAVYESHGFAMARSANRVLTARIQREIGRMVREGVTVPQATGILERMGGFTRSYAETVYRTNLNTAYSAGRWKQAADPEVRELMPAAIVSTTNDSDLRRGREEDRGENHAAADGFVADTRSPRWDRMSPPYGYMCRCSMRLVSTFELKRRRLIRDGRVIDSGIPPAFRPHRNFARGRPDRAIYLGRAQFGAADFSRAWPASHDAERRHP